ncbi:MAG: hypothetical protein HQL27_08695 [Candidatus Omnitrophica bacterium]|nr:hypothetical protein [Candidatus Omnitrophota bacterium]
MPKFIFTLTGYVKTFIKRNQLSYGTIGISDEEKTGEVSEYTKVRVNLLVDFIKENDLDTLIIFGCAYGRELLPLSKKLESVNQKIQIIGADINKEAMDACSKYGLKNSVFYVVNMECSRELEGLFSKVQGNRIGVYCCETAPYLLPGKFRNFVKVCAQNSRIKGFQLLEAAYIDYDSFWDVGMLFTFQGNYWRHNYPKVIKRHFSINKIYFLDPKLRTNVHLNQPLWFISASK